MRDNGREFLCEGGETCLCCRQQVALDEVHVVWEIQGSPVPFQVAGCVRRRVVRVLVPIVCDVYQTVPASY